MSGTEEEPVFKGAEQFFDDYYNTVRGYVRQEIIRLRLQPHLQDGQRALDFGGGDARDSIWVANNGVDVDYWDNFLEAQSRARRAVIKADGIGYIRLHDQDPTEDPTTTRYELIMLHGVIQYESPPKAEQILERLSKVSLQGALLSLATKNWAVVDSQEESPGVKVHTTKQNKTSRAYSAEYLTKWLGKVGFSVVDIRGVRCLSDDDERMLSEVPKEELDQIISEENYRTEHKDSLEIGQMLHVLAIKR